MKNGSNPAIRITSAFAFGIVLSQCPQNRLIVLLPCLLVMAIAWIFLHRRNLRKRSIGSFSLILLSALTLIGMLAGHAAALRPGNAVELFGESTLAIDAVANEDARPCKSGRKVVVKCRGKLAGKLLVYLPAADSATTVHAGDQLHFEAAIRPLGGGHPGYEAYLRNIGVFATARASQLVVTGQENNWRLPLADLRRNLKGRIMAHMPDQEIGGLAVAMLLGDRSGLNREMRNDFSQAGLAHILAISGLHVGILFVFLSRLLGFLAVSPTGSKVRTLLVVLLLVMYALLTGGSPAVCRAVMMLSMMELGKMLFRSRNSLNLLAVSALVQLVIDPMLIFNIGFQLSYAAVAGILTLGPRIERQAGKAFPGLGRKTKGALAVCLAAQLCTAPLIAFHFHQFPTYFLLSNLLLLPVVSLTVVIGFSGMLLVWVPGLSQLLFGVLDCLLAVIAWLSGQISSLPGAVVENFSFSDPAPAIFLAMIALILTSFFRIELTKMNAGGRERLDILLRHLTMQGQWSRVAGYGMVAAFIATSLLIA